MTEKEHEEKPSGREGGGGVPFFLRKKAQEKWQGKLKNLQKLGPRGTRFNLSGEGADFSLKGRKKRNSQLTKNDQRKRRG